MDDLVRTPRHRKMLIRFCLAILLIVSFSIGCSGIDRWSYEDNKTLGQEKWPTEYKICKGKEQSPVDIASSQPDNSLSKLNFNGYDRINNVVKVLHVRHNVKFVPEFRMSISGGGLPASYMLEQFDFHWRNDASYGSEHTINGKGFPVEMQFVHWNTMYPNYLRAAYNPDGLAILGIMIDVASDDSPLLNEELGNFIKSFDSIRLNEKRTNTTPFKLEEFFPRNLQYYRYRGSITIPPCMESVIWNVVKEPIYLTKNQVEEFRTFHDPDEPKYLINRTNRDIQPINERTVSISPSFPLPPRPKKGKIDPTEVPAYSGCRISFFLGFFCTEAVAVLTFLFLAQFISCRIYSFE